MIYFWMPLHWAGLLPDSGYASRESVERD